MDYPINSVLYPLTEPFLVSASVPGQDHVERVVPSWKDGIKGVAAILDKMAKAAGFVSDSVSRTMQEIADDIRSRANLDTTVPYLCVSDGIFVITLVPVKWRNQMAAAAEALEAENATRH